MEQSNYNYCVWLCVRLHSSLQMHNSHAAWQPMTHRDVLQHLFQGQIKGMTTRTSQQWKNQLVSSVSCGHENAYLLNL